MHEVVLRMRMGVLQKTAGSCAAEITWTLGHGTIKIKGSPSEGRLPRLLCLPAVRHAALARGFSVDKFGAEARIIPAPGSAHEPISEDPSFPFLRRVAFSGDSSIRAFFEQLTFSNLPPEGTIAARRRLFRLPFSGVTSARRSEP